MAGTKHFKDSAPLGLAWEHCLISSREVSARSSFHKARPNGMGLSPRYGTTAPVAKVSHRQRYFHSANYSPVGEKGALSASPKANDLIEATSENPTGRVGPFVRVRCDRRLGSRSLVKRNGTDFDGAAALRTSSGRAEKQPPSRSSYASGEGPLAKRL